MRFCKLSRFAFYILPLKILQDKLIQRHMLQCPECRARLAKKEEASAWLIQESDTQDIPDFWPQVEATLKSNQGTTVNAPLLFRWRWALRAAGFVLAVTVSIWIYSYYKPHLSSDEIQQPDRFRLKYVRIAEEPAQTFLYQPKDTDMIFIWAGKNGGGMLP